MIEKMPQNDVDMLRHTSFYMWEIAIRLNQIIDVINSQEDVAPVVCCENCKYFKEMSLDNWNYDGMCRWFNTHAVCKKDFCSRYKYESKDDKE